MPDKKYWNAAFKLSKVLKDSIKPILIDTVLDLLNFKSEEELVNFFVECSLTGMDIDWSNRTVIFTKDILPELENLLGEFELQSLLDK